MKTCAECDYFEPGTNGQGDCHAVPPVIMALPVQGITGQGIGVKYMRPRVKGDERYCDRFIAIGAARLSEVIVGHLADTAPSKNLFQAP